MSWGDFPGCIPQCLRAKLNATFQTNANTDCAEAIASNGALYKVSKDYPQVGESGVAAGSASYSMRVSWQIARRASARSFC